MGFSLFYVALMQQCNITDIFIFQMDDDKSPIEWETAGGMCACKNTYYQVLKLVRSQLRSTIRIGIAQ